MGTAVVTVAMDECSQPPGQLVTVIKLVLVYVIVEVDTEVDRLVLPVVTYVEVEKQTDVVVMTLSFY